MNDLPEHEKNEDEIDENKDFEKDLVYSDITGKTITPPAPDPKPGIDYITAFEGEKDEIQLDE